MKPNQNQSHVGESILGDEAAVNAFLAKNPQPMADQNQATMKTQNQDKATAAADLLFNLTDEMPIVKCNQAREAIHFLYDDRAALVAVADAALLDQFERRPLSAAMTAALANYAAARAEQEAK